jgi:hypothetical protein
MKYKDYLSINVSDAFIPAMTAPNMLPNISDEAYMHVLPTVSYKSGSSALLPILARPMCNSNGLHPLFNQNASTMMAMTMSNYSSKQPLLSIPFASKHPQAFLKALPNFYNQNGRSPSSPIKNIMDPNNRPSFPTPNIKNANFLPPMMHVPFNKQMIPIKDRNMEQKIPNHCETQHVYSDINQPSFIQDEMIQNNEEQTRMHCNNHQNLNSRFGALVKEYGEARNMAEKVARVQKNDQEALHTRFGALVKEFNEARNLAVIQSDEKKMRIRNRSEPQLGRSQDYGEQMMSDECKNDKMTKEQNNDFCDQTMNFKNNEELPKMYDDGHEQAQDVQSNEEVPLLQNINHEELQSFQNNEQIIDMEKDGKEQMQNFQNNNQTQRINNNCYNQKKKIQNNDQTQRAQLNGNDQMRSFYNNEQMQRIQTNGNDQMKTFQNNEQMQRAQNNAHDQVENFQNSKQMSRMQNDGHDQVKTCQNINELSKMHRNGIGFDQIKSFLNSDAAKIKVFSAFNPINGLSNLSGLTPKEFKIQKENELFAQMEKNYQRKIKIDTSHNEPDKKDERNNESVSRIKNKSYEEKMKGQKKIDAFNNDEEVISVHNKNIQNKSNNSLQDYCEHESIRYNGSQSTHSTISNNTEFDNNSTSNNMTSPKHQSWSPQKNREEKKPSPKPQIQKNAPHKIQIDQPPSPKKAHVSIRDRIAQAAKQAIDDLIPEPLTEAQMSESIALLKLIDTYYVQCLYSKEWKLRDKALQYMVQEIKNEKISGDILDVFR